MFVKLRENTSLLPPIRQTLVDVWRSNVAAGAPTFDEYIHKDEHARNAALDVDGGSPKRRLVARM
jgi:hypothetical protein